MYPHYEHHDENHTRYTIVKLQALADRYTGPMLTVCEIQPAIAAIYIQWGPMMNVFAYVFIRVRGFITLLSFLGCCGARAAAECTPFPLSGE